MIDGKPSIHVVKKYTGYLAAGDYYLCDPCYCFGDSWDDLIKQTNCFEDPLFYKNGKWGIAFSTALGDGVYRDNDGNEYSVDAGLIGLVPVSAADHSPGEALAKKVTFSRPVRVTCDGEGRMEFGRFRIDTTE